MTSCFLCPSGSKPKAHHTSLVECVISVQAPLLCEPSDGTDDLTVMARLLEESTALRQQLDRLKRDLTLLQEVAQDVETQWQKFFCAT